MRSEHPVFLLIAGALHPAWVWHRVVPLLEQAGYAALAPDLPGMGEDRSMPAGEVTLATWTEFLVGRIEAIDAPVILVGHSRAGLVIGEAAERVPERVLAMVYVAGLAVPPGRTANETMAIKANMEGMTRTPDGKAFMLPPEAVIAMMYNRCAPEDAEEAARRLTPEPFAPLSTPSTVTAGRWGRVPRIYLEMSDDRTLVPERQRIIQAEAGCERTITIDTDHSPFLSAPSELAAALASIADLSARRAPAFENATRRTG